MRVTSLVLFGAGYVLGAKAGRRRYEQIMALTSKAAARFDDKSVRDPILQYADGTRPLLTSAISGAGPEATSSVTAR